MFVNFVVLVKFTEFSHKKKVFLILVKLFSYDIFNEMLLLFLHIFHVTYLTYFCFSIINFKNTDFQKKLNLRNFWSFVFHNNELNFTCFEIGFSDMKYSSNLWITIILNPASFKNRSFNFVKLSKLCEYKTK